MAWYRVESGQVDDDSLKQVTKYAERALQLDRETEQEWHRRAVLGWVLTRRRIFDRAEKELQRSIEIEPERMQNRYYLALLYVRLGESARAKAELAKALALKEGGIWRGKAEELVQELSK